MRVKSQIPEPIVPPCEDWGTMEKLRREKEVVGIYLSGHPLDDFKKEITAFCNTSVSVFKDDLNGYVNRELCFCRSGNRCTTSNFQERERLGSIYAGRLHGHS